MHPHLHLERPYLSTVFKVCAKSLKSHSMPRPPSDCCHHPLLHSCHHPPFHLCRHPLLRSRHHPPSICCHHPPYDCSHHPPSDCCHHPPPACPSAACAVLLGQQLLPAGALLQGAPNQPLKGRAALDPRPTPTRSVACPMCAQACRRAVSCSAAPRAVALCLKF